MSDTPILLNSGTCRSAVSGPELRLQWQEAWGSQADWPQPYACQGCSAGAVAAK